MKRYPRDEFDPPLISNENNNRGRKRSKSRSRSRSNSRDRKRQDRNNNNYQQNNNYQHYDGRGRGGGYHHGGGRGFQDGGRGSSYGNRDYQNSSGYNNNYQQQQQQNQAEPSSTVVIKGLSSHTVEPTEGECKGFAFVEFHSVEYAQYFMTTFAGSAGDPNAPQLIVDNRSVTIEYGDKRKENSVSNNGFGNRPPGTGGDFHHRKDEKPIRSDWLCDACGCHNFARRDICFRCNLPRTENAVAVNQSGETFGDSMVSCDTPGAFLAVRGFGPFMTEDQLMELFRQFAVVKSAVIVRDQMTRMSKGLAFVEFQSVEHASYAIQCSQDIKIGDTPLKLAYAREAVMHQIIAQSQNIPPTTSVPPSRFTAAPGVQNALLASAMQAAQWSINNGYAAAPGANVLPGAAASVAGGVIGKPAVFWPPNFDTHGSAYVFQTKSGYFLEPLTEFYYCPKSKLYYSAKEGIYYHYDATIDPPFKKFLPPAPTEPEETSNNSAVGEHSNHNTTGEAAGSAEKRPLVSVNLTQKIKVKATIAPPKKVLKDLAKWEAVQKEEEEVAEREEQQQQADTVAASNSVFVKRQDSKQANPPNPTVTLSSQQQTEIDTSQQQTSPVPDASPTPAAPAATVGGQPVCLLCQRKFASMEILARHEKESKLHLDNLAKQKQQQQQLLPQYRDRAEERREKFGSVADHLPKDQSVIPAPSSSTSSNTASPPINLATFILPPPPPPAKPVAVSKDQSNPGNQMLRKMGWREGQGLGKDGDGKEIAVGVEISEGKNHSSMHQTLRTTTGAGSGGGAGGISGNYKESVYAASRSRFEQILKNEKK